MIHLHIYLSTHGHGRCCTSLVWIKFFEPLAKAGFNIIAFDAPCFGRSSGASTGQANLWRSNDYELILRLLECFGAGHGSVYFMAQCMGAAMMLRAMSVSPDSFGHHFVVHNATLGIWPDNIDSILKSKGGHIMGWHEVDQDLMREAVCYKNLKRLANIGLCTFTDSALERECGRMVNVLDKNQVIAPHLSRDSHLLYFDPTLEQIEKIMSFFLSRPRLRLNYTVWNPPSETAVQQGHAFSSKINVCIRMRPHLSHENEDYRAIYGFDLTSHGPSISYQRRGFDNIFVFNHIFTPESRGDDVFLPVQSLLDGVKAGLNHGTIFAYGQTASGKTYTVAELMRQVIPQLLSVGSSITVKLSQIYQNRTYDLLESNKLCSDGALSSQSVTKEADFFDLYDTAIRVRKTAHTAMNADSSRSHVIMALTLDSHDRHLCVVDLAGSERVKKSLVINNSFSEAAEINNSLLVLSRVLRAKITPGTTHVPYRDCALTKALESVFESYNHRAVLYACISPCKNDLFESDQTLKFASNATHVCDNSRSTEDIRCDESVDDLAICS